MFLQKADNRQKLFKFFDICRLCKNLQKLARFLKLENREI